MTVPEKEFERARDALFALEEALCDLRKDPNKDPDSPERAARHKVFRLRSELGSIWRYERKRAEW